MKNSEKIILASASPRRRELLERAGVPFEVRVSDADESADAHGHPAELAMANARLKAVAVARKNTGRYVLGADTVVWLAPNLYGKPRDLDDARRMLGELRGKTHSVFTGVCAAYCPADGAEVRTLCDFGESRVAFRNLDESQIAQYLSKVDVLDKAGAYAAQEHGSMIIDDIDGGFDNVMGLPVELAKKTLDTLARKMQTA